MYLRRELVLISDNLSSETLNTKEQSAEKIIESKRKGVFRIHDKPDEKKIAEIDSFIKRLGYRINISNSKDPNKTINKLLELIN